MQEREPKVPFFRLPTQVMDRLHDIPSNVYAVYMCCLSYVDSTNPQTGYCPLSTKQIAVSVNRKKGTVKNLLYKLAEFDLGKYEDGLLFIRTCDNDGKYPSEV